MRRSEIDSRDLQGWSLLHPGRAACVRASKRRVLSAYNISSPDRRDVADLSPTYKTLAFLENDLEEGHSLIAVVAAVVVVPEDTVSPERAEVEHERFTRLSAAMIWFDLLSAIDGLGCKVDTTEGDVPRRVLSDTLRCMMSGESIAGSRGVKRRAPMSRLRLPGVRLCRGAFVQSGGMLRGFRLLLAMREMSIV